MSLLDLLKTKKKSLKPTETIITQVDGQKYVQSKDNIVALKDNTYGFVVDTRPDDVPAKVVEHLYIGSQDCCELKVLEMYSIRNVLSVGIEAPVKYDNVTYKFIPCYDLPETQIQDIILECIPYIDEAIGKKSNVLVHCNAGVSRSSSVVIGYLMYTYKYSYQEAYEIVKKARNCIQPNPGFQKQLQNLKTDNYHNLPP